MALLRALITRMLYPPDTVCVACGRLRVDVMAWSLCLSCAESLVPLEASAPPPGQEALDFAHAAYAYEGVAAQLVRALKYACVYAAAECLADGMADSMPLILFDAVVPIPLHPSRLRTRGFNQAEVLAKAVALRTGLPCLDLLRRNRPTRTQTKLSADARMKNVQDAFTADPSAQSLRVLLIDDVLTTGATAGACAVALRQKGVKSVSLLAATKAIEAQNI